MTNLVILFQGGVSYSGLMDMPIPELQRLIVEAERITKELA